MGGNQVILEFETLVIQPGLAKCPTYFKGFRGTEMRLLGMAPLSALAQVVLEPGGDLPLAQVGQIRIPGSSNAVEAADAFLGPCAGYRCPRLPGMPTPGMGMKIFIEAALRLDSWLVVIPGNGATFRVTADYFSRRFKPGVVVGRPDEPDWHPSEVEGWRNLEVHAVPADFQGLGGFALNSILAWQRANTHFEWNAPGMEQSP